jgi:signal peptidase II
VLYFAVAALVVILDQASKRIIWEIYKYGGTTDVLDGVLRITLSKNTGAIMGIFSGSRNILLVITIVSIAALILFAYRMRFAPVAKRVYLGLILGGAFGNLIDRMATGEVLLAHLQCSRYCGNDRCCAPDPGIYKAFRYASK